MFKQELKEKYPFLTEYFENVFSNKEQKCPHSILFYGQDISAQYEISTEIARLLNCSDFKDENCKCLNCHWVRDKNHPAVLTYSKFDNKSSDDESKTVISIAQTRAIKNSLLNTSDYHRIFIFCDAENKDDKWVPLGLNKNNFKEETANSILKIIEEPPENTTFFFLARDKNDLLETIISRSQCFFVPSFKQEERDFSLVEEAFADYPNIEKKDFLKISQKLVSLSKENGEDKILNEVQNFLVAALKSNLDNILLKNKILNDLKLVKLSEEMIVNHINPQSAFEDLILKMSS